MEKKEFIEAGRIVNTHGVIGEVKIEVWLDSPQFFKSFRKLYTKAGEELKVTSAKTHKGCVIAKLDGIDSINDAMRLKGKDISIREWLRIVPIVSIVVAILDTIDGYKGVTRSELHAAEPTYF